MKRISIITINYNNRDGLIHTIESVLSQLYSECQFIIIDGNSNDGSRDVIRRYNDRIDYWVSEPDNGVYHAMNKGIAVADGDYCIFMNSGDCFYDENVLSKAVQFCSADILVGETNVVRQINGEFVTQEVFKVPDVMTGKHLIEYGFNHQSSFIKTELLKRNNYDEELKYVSDWKFFIQELIFNNCSYQSLPFIVANYDFSGITSQSANYHAMSLERDKVMRQLFPERIIYDYQCLLEGTTELERLVFKINHDSTLYKLITHITRALTHLQMAWCKLKRGR
jgi:glycosyltransferase involved in cell wall biosynthesis